MKRLIALAVLSCSAVSYASPREIYDLVYLPNAGTTYGFSELNYIKGSFETNSTDVDFGGYALSQTVGHAFTDRLSLQGNLSYSNVVFDPDGGKNFDHSGISDPRITARFRAIDEDLRVDVFGGAVVGLGDSEIKANGDRNRQSGGSSLFIGTQFGKTIGDYQWAVLGQLQHNMTRDQEDKSKSDEYEIEPHNELLLGVESQKKIKENSLVRAYAQVNMVETADIDENTTTISPSTDYIFGGEYRHLLSKDLMLRAGLDYNIKNQDTGTNKDYNFWRLNLGANYQF